MIDTIETVMNLASAPSGFLAIGMAAALMLLVRRSGNGRRRTD